MSSEFTVQAMHYRRRDETVGTVEVSAAPTACPYLVITPGVYSNADGVGFTGGLTLTHTLTGRRITVDTNFARLQELAKLLAEFDWAFSDPDHVNPETIKEVATVVREWEMAQAPTRPVSLWGDDDEKRAARAAAPATTLLAETIDWWLKHAEEFRKRLDIDKDRDAYFAEISSSVNGYGMVYLLAVLRAVDPKVADIAARDLVAQYDAGDCMGEWVYQWNEEIAKGEPLTLRGIPSVEPLAEFSTQAGESS